MKVEYWNDLVLLESGFSLIRIRKYWGVINTEMELIIPTIYHYILPLKNSQWFLVFKYPQTKGQSLQTAIVDLHHTIIFPFASREGLSYDSFNNSITYREVGQNPTHWFGYKFFITENGLLADPDYIWSKYAFFTQGALKGVINHNKEIVLKAEWQQIHIMNHFFCTEDQENQWFIIPISNYEKIPIEGAVVGAVGRNKNYLQIRKGGVVISNV